MPKLRSAKVIQDALEAFLRERYGLSGSASAEAAVDVVEIAKALSYASGRRGQIDASSLARSIEAAVLGYLRTKARDRLPQQGPNASRNGAATH